MALDTVQDYISLARSLLQDAVAPYRYPDVDLLRALSLGLMEAYRLRRDLFLAAPPATYTTNDTTLVPMDLQYRVAIVYYIVGHVQLRDDEQTQDARAASLLNKFTQQMLQLG